MSRLDRTGDSTEEWRFLNHHKDLLKKPDPAWHFTKDELTAIAIIYLKLQKDAGVDYKQELPIQSFFAVLHKAFGMPDETLFERMCSALAIKSTVPLRNWLDAMAMFLRADIQQQIEYCFRVYDVAGKGEIRRENIVFFYKQSFYRHHVEEIDETVKDFADIAIKKLDLDKDGIVKFDDYSKSVTKDPMLLECFGPCLPDRRHVRAFLMTFTDKIKAD